MKKRRRNPLLLTVHNPAAVRWQGVRREDGSPVRIVETGERWIVQQQHGRKWVPVADAGNSIDAFRAMRVELGTVDEQKGNPYWLKGKRGRIALKATAGQTATEKDVELTLHDARNPGAIDYETATEARQRQRAEVAERKLWRKKAAQRPRTAGGAIVKRGGIDIGHPSWRTWPHTGTKDSELSQVKIGGRHLFRRGTKTRPALRWDRIHEVLREEGFLVAGDDIGPFVDAWLSGSDVEHPEDGAWQAQEGRRAASRVHRELRRENPTGDALAAFRTFHEVDPKEIVERSIPAVRGDLVALGDLVAICYRPTRGWRRGPAFEHRFGRGAILAATADGKALVLIPGPKPFRVDWRRGIVD